MGGGVHSYPTVYVNGKSDLVLSARKALGVPDTMDDEDWIESLFHHLSPNNQVSALPVSMFSFSCSCLGARGQVSDDGSYTNTAGNLPPVIVLDNVHTLLPDTVDLLEEIYQKAKVYRVLAVVITHKPQVANYVVAMNGARVEPLEGRYHLAEGFEEYKTVPSPEYPRPNQGLERTTVGIEWLNEEWPRGKQHEYLLKYGYKEMAKERRHLSAVDGCFSFLVAGENPSQASVQASKYCRRRNPAFKRATKGSSTYTRAKKSE